MPLITRNTRVVAWSVKTAMSVNESSAAQIAKPVEYADHISKRGAKLPNQFPGYDIKQSNGKAPVLGNVAYLSIAIASMSSLTRRSSSSTC